MKRLKLFFACLLMAVLSIGQMWATDQLVYTLAPATTGGNSAPHNNYAAAAEVEIDDITWSVTGNSSMVPWRIGGGKNTGLDHEVRTVFSKTAMSEAINKVELSVGAASGITVNTLTLIVASNSDFSTQIDAVTETFAANSTITFQPTSPLTEWATGAYYKFVFNVSVAGTPSSHKFVAFNEAKFYKEGSATPTVAADPDEVEVDAAAHASQSLALTYENWGTVNVADVNVTLWDNAACTEALSGDWIDNVSVAAGNASLTYDIAANTGNARTAYMKIYVLGNDASTDAETVVTISQAKYVAPFTGNTLEITPTAFATGGYTANDGGINVDGFDFGVKDTYKNGSVIQAKASTGHFYNESILGEIVKIELTQSGAGGNNFVVYEGTTENPSTTSITPEVDGSTKSFTFSSGKTHFSLNNGGAYSTLSLIKIYYYPIKSAVTIDPGIEHGTVGVSGAADLTQVAAGTAMTLSNTPDGGYELGAYDVYKTGDPSTKVTITAGAFTMPAYPVTVSATFNALKTLSSIEITTPATQTTFWQGETFNADGMVVTAHYSDAADEGVTPDNVEGSTATAGNQTVTVTYETVNTTYNINVRAVPNTEETAYTVAEAVDIIAKLGGTINNVYVSGIVSQVDGIDGGAITYWISDDGTKTNQFEVYKGKNNGGASFSALTDVKVGDEVIVKGNIKDFYGTKEFTTGSQLVSQERTPAFTIADVVQFTIGDDDLAVGDLNVTKDGSGAITLVSGDETKATIVSNAIHAEAAGDVVITANLAKDGIFKAATTTFNVHIIAPCEKAITVSKGTSDNGDFSLDKEGALATCDAAVVVIVSTDPDTHFHATGVVAPNSSEISGPDGDGKFTVTYAQNTNASSAISVTFAADPEAVITLNNYSGSAVTTGYYPGESFTLPSANDYVCGLKTFVGWSTVAITEEGAKPTSNYYEPGASVTLDATNTFYAVFAEASGSTTEYVLTAYDAVDAGKYIIAAYYNEKYLTLTGAITGSSNYDLENETTGVTLTDGKFTTAPTGACEFTLTGNSTDGFVIRNAEENGYLGYTSSTTSRRLALGASYDDITWDILEKEKTDYPTGCYIESSDGYKVSCGDINTLSTSFVRGYTNSTYRPIYFFKKTSVATYSNYATTCCTPLEITGDIDITPARESATVEWAKVADATGYQYKVNDGAWTAAVVADMDAPSITVSGLTGATDYTIYLRANGTGDNCAVGVPTTGTAFKTLSRVSATENDNTYGTAQVSLTSGSGWADYVDAANGTTIYLKAEPTSASYAFSSWDAPVSGSISENVLTGWSGDVTVTANFAPAELPTLATPTGMNKENVTAISATLKWNAVANAVNYTVVCTGATIGSVTENEGVCSCPLTNLTAGTEYTWTVQAIGDNVNYKSGVACDAQDFTTVAKQPTLVEITTNPTKTTYNAGETFDATGMVVRVTYNNGDVDNNYTEYTFAPTTALTATDTKVTISATLNAVTETADVDIVVNAQLTWKVAGADDVYTYASAGKVVLPANPSVPACMGEFNTFVGWGAEIATPTTSAPSYVSASTDATADATYYAIFARTEAGNPAAASSTFTVTDAAPGSPYVAADGATWTYSESGVNFNDGNNSGFTKNLSGWIEVELPASATEAVSYVITKTGNAWAGTAQAFLTSGSTDIATMTGSALSYEFTASDKAYGTYKLANNASTTKGCWIDYIVINYMKQTVNAVEWTSACPAPTVYTVTFNTDGGSTIDPVEVEEGQAVAKPADPTKDDYNFVEWQLNGVAYDFTAAITANITLDAVWEPVTPPAPAADYTRNVTNGNYGTICLPKAGTISGAKLMEVAYFDGSMIYCDEILNGEMEAGVPYIFQATSDQLSVVYDDNTIAPIAASDANGLYGFYDLENMATDNAAQKNLTQDDGNYILYQNQYWLVSGRAAYINNFRAYIKLYDISTTAPEPTPGAAPRRRVAMTVNGAQNATGSENINASETPVKMIIDGKLFILRGEKMYDATGRLVK